MNTKTTQKMTNYRWVICTMLFLATTINYMDSHLVSWSLYARIVWFGNHVAPEHG